jgi:hypothetical protein
MKLTIDQTFSQNGLLSFGETADFPPFSRFGGFLRLGNAESCFFAPQNSPKCPQRATSNMSFWGDILGFSGLLPAMHLL